MILIFFGLLGLCIGSFLNVVADRTLKGKSIIYPPSKCDFCHHRLFALDLIPVFSFLFLKGKCRYCRRNLSWQYPSAELITAGTYVFLAWLFFTFQIDLFFFIYLLIMASCLIVIILTDIKEQIILDEVLIIQTAATSLYLFFFHQELLLISFISGIGFFLFLLCLFFITKGKGMGFGDVKFAFVIGLALGFPKVIVSFYLSFLTGALVSLILVMISRKSIKSAIPFGPFLAISLFISLLYGDGIWVWALKLLGFA